MKTPRELLLEKNAGALPDLDRVRRAALDEIFPPPRRRPARSPLAWAATLWEQLVLPSRYAWAGVAAAWLIIVAVNVTQAGGGAAATTSQTTAPAQLEMVREQRALEAELLGTRLVAQPAQLRAPQDRSAVPEFRANGAFGWRDDELDFGNFA